MKSCENRKINRFTKIQQSLCEKRSNEEKKRVNGIERWRNSKKMGRKRDRQGEKVKREREVKTERQKGSYRRKWKEGEKYRDRDKEGE